MIHDDDLGALLRGELRALTSDISPSPALVERIERTTRSTHTIRRWSTRRRLLAGVPVALAAALAAAVLALEGSGPPPAFAVTTDADGSVQVTIAEMVGITGANARLEQLGVRARVVPMTAQCSTHVAMTYIGIAQHPGNPVTVDATTIPAGTTILLAAREVGDSNLETAVGKVTGRVPTCVSSNGVGPGVPGGSPADARSQAVRSRAGSR